MKSSTELNDTNLVRVDPVVILTAICVTLVLILHHASYTVDFLSPIRPFFIHKIVQRFAVGGFIFLSGFKLAASKLTTSAKSFLINRLLKIYGLYIFAVVIFSATAYPHLNNGDFPSIANIFLHLLAFQSILPNYFGAGFHTLWFVSILFSCYGTFLLLRPYLYRSNTFGLISLLLISFIYLFRSFASQYKVGLFQDDFEIWVSIFLLGMVYSKAESRSHITQLGQKTVWIAGMGTVTLLGLYNLSPAFPLGIYKLIEFFLLISTLFFSFTWILSKDIRVSRKIADSLILFSGISYCIFLIHRSVWSVMVFVWPERSLLQALFILGCGLPLIFACSYALQQFYTFLLTHKKRALQ